MPDIKNQPEITDAIDVPPLAPDEVMAPVHDDVQPALDAAAGDRRARQAAATAERNARKAREREELNARLLEVEALEARCKAVRRNRTLNYMEMLDLIAEMPAFSLKRRRAIIAELFGLGRAEASRLLKIGPLDADFRKFMIQHALAPEFIEALLRAPDNVRQIALDQIEEGEVVERLDLTRLKRELDRDNPAVAAAQKNKALAASLIMPIRNRLKQLQLSMREMVPKLVALHRVGENAEDVENMCLELTHLARLHVTAFEACYGGERLRAAMKQERLTDSALASLGEDDVRERFQLNDELFSVWSPEELRAAETYDALRKLAAGNFMPTAEYDEDTDYYLSRYIIEAIAWYADYDLKDYQAELEKLKRPESRRHLIVGHFPTKSALLLPSSFAPELGARQSGFTWPVSSLSAYLSSTGMLSRR